MITRSLYTSSSKVIGRPSSSIAAMIEVVLRQSGLYSIGVSTASAGSEGRPDGLNSVFRTSGLNWTFLGERSGERVRNGFILSIGSVPLP